MVQGIVAGTIEWEEDPDFGYYVAKALPGFPDDELLRPHELYERQDRLDEYAAIVAALTDERREYLRSYPGLDESVVNAI